MQTIREVMTPDPISLGSEATLQEAAAAMRSADVGAVVVVDEDSIRGIVTDRDIVVRAVADGLGPTDTRLAEVCTDEVVTVSSESPVEEAVQIMRDRALRRLPVVDGGELRGIVSLGDLAIERDPRSALADISAAPPNA